MANVIWFGIDIFIPDNCWYLADRLLIFPLIDNILVEFAKLFAKLSVKLLFVECEFMLISSIFKLLFSNFIEALIKEVLPERELISSNDK